MQTIAEINVLLNRMILKSSPAILGKCFHPAD